MHILAITPGRGHLEGAWLRVFRSGVDGLLIREYAMEAGALLACARRTRDLAPPGLELWIAGRLDVALAAGCGLHAPEAYPEVDPALLPLSRPLHAEAQFPSRRGARQLLVAPVFPTPGKQGAWGPARLHAWLDSLPPHGPRVLALGGIDPGNAAALKHPRLDGVALIRALWEAEAPERVVEALRRAWG